MGDLLYLGAGLRVIDLEQPRFHGMPSFTAHGPVPLALVPAAHG